LHVTDIHEDAPCWHSATGARESRQTAALRPVAGFPDLRLLWRLRLEARASADCLPWHPLLRLTHAWEYTSTERRRCRFLATQPARRWLPILAAG
jgi:hypothetical protein